MSITDKWHTVSLNREKHFSEDNYLKIDDMHIHGIQNVKIEYGINEPYPVITIQFLAKKLDGQIKSKDIKKKK